MFGSIRWSLAAALTLAAACAPAAPKVDLAAEETAIRAKVTEWNGFLQSKNDSAITALYGDRGALFPAGMPKIVGAAAMRPFWAQLWAMNVNLVLSTVSVTVAQSGDLAVEEGTYTFEIPGTPADKGKYLVVWYKQDGKWLVAQDIWNSDMTPPAAPAAMTQ
jgi:ketosteroid isomerase-like protein